MLPGQWVLLFPGLAADVLLALRVYIYLPLGLAATNELDSDATEAQALGLSGPETPGEPVAWGAGAGAGTA